MIPIEDFQKLDIRIGKILTVEDHPKADKLYVLTVDFGSDIGIKTIVAGLRAYIKKEDLESQKATFIVNLEPVVLRGIESQGMILAAGNKETGEFSILSPTSNIEEGTKVS